MDGRRQLVDPMQREATAALALADAAAPGDPARSLELFKAIVNLVDRERDARSRGRSLRSHDPMIEDLVRRDRMRRSVRGAPTPMVRSTPRIADDPAYQKNVRAVITRRTRIYGGVPTTQFDDCVAVGSTRQWGCTGTLISPNVVVTAGHCQTHDFAARVFFGRDARRPSSGRIVRVQKAVVHPKYRGDDKPYDLAVLVLDETVRITPRRIAPRGAVARAKSVRLVGYGATDSSGQRGYGLRRVVDVPTVTPKKEYGALRSVEFVAAAPLLDRDSCNGDSGGPAYVQVGGGWALAGATSRGIGDGCGDGGIYTRLYPFVDWIRSIPGVRWRDASHP